ncbi:hypothetical protein [Chitinophaga costaii]|nr:hypothetical protein [Chitinophaga costaii]
MKSNLVNLQLKIANKKNGPVLIVALFLLGCHSPKDMKKEVWELPCGYKGFATVYFDESANASANDDRVYHLDTSGVSVVDYPLNDGFAPNLKEYVIVVMKCANKIDTLPYYNNDELDTVRRSRYATRLIVGKKGDKYFRSIYVENGSVK